MALNCTLSDRAFHVDSENVSLRAIKSPMKSSLVNFDKIFKKIQQLTHELFMRHLMALNDTLSDAAFRADSEKVSLRAIKSHRKSSLVIW